MSKQDGKLTFTGILILAIIFYGGFAAFKFISASFEETQIMKEIEDKLGLMRGPYLTEEKAAEIAVEILEKKDIIFTEDHAENTRVSIDRKSGRMVVTIEFEMEVNLIFFKHKKAVRDSKEMSSFN